MAKYFALAILLASATPLHATVTDLGTLVPGVPYFASDSNLVGPFDDLINFSVPTAGRIAYEVIQVNNTLFSFAPNGLPPNGTLSEFTARSGANFIDVSGSGGITFGQSTRPGQYLLFLGFEPASTVPEADTWVMLTIGAGLLGWRLRKDRSPV